VKAVSQGLNTAILIAVLVAVLITLSLVVAIWMRLNESPGPSVNTVAVTQTTTPVLATTTTPAMSVETENLVITVGYATLNQESGGWTIYLTVRNIGATDAVIDNVFINGKQLGSYSGISISPPLPMPIKAGSEARITIMVPGNIGFVSGQMIEVMLHSTSGREYPEQVVLP